MEGQPRASWHSLCGNRINSGPTEERPRGWRRVPSVEEDRQERSSRSSHVARQCFMGLPKETSFTPSVTRWKLREIPSWFPTDQINNPFRASLLKWALVQETQHTHCHQRALAGASWDYTWFADLERDFWSPPLCYQPLVCWQAAVLSPRESPY